MLRKSFDLAAPVAQTRLHLAVADKYLLYVNGQYVGREPCRSIGPRWISYDTRDVTAYLKPGRNTLAVLAYFYGGGDRHPFSHFKRAGLFAQLEVDLANGSRALIVSDESWKVRAASGFRRDVKVGNGSSQIPTEVYEAGRDPEDWMNTDYDDSVWDQAVQLPDADWQYLEPRVTPLLCEREVFPVKLVTVGEVDPVGQTGSRILRLLGVWKQRSMVHLSTAKLKRHQS
jgi:alpha-L-rhamnosidase